MISFEKVVIALYKQLKRRFHGYLIILACVCLNKEGRYWWGTKVGKFPRDGRMIWESEKARWKFPPLTLSQAALRRRQQASASCMETRPAYGWHLLRPHPLGPPYTWPPYIIYILLLGPPCPHKFWPYILGPLNTWHPTALPPITWLYILGPVKMRIHAPSQRQIGWKTPFAEFLLSLVIVMNVHWLSLVKNAFI